MMIRKASGGRRLHLPPAYGSNRRHPASSPAQAPTPTPTTTMAQLSLVRRFCSSGLPLPNDLLRAPDPRTVLPTAYQPNRSHPPLPLQAPTPTLARLSLVRRFCSSRLHLPPLPNDLLRAPDPCTVRMEPFIVNVGQVKRLEDAMDSAKAMSKEQMKVTARRDNFEEFFRAALVRRGLLWNQSLITEESRVLHSEYRRILGAPPKYLTADRFMVHVEEMPRPNCRQFLDFLSKTRTVVLDDWITKLSTSLSLSMYDLGAHFAGQEAIYHKGESDASYDEGKATVGAILWVNSQIYACEIYCDVPCNSSNMAEAKAMFLQLELGIPLLFLQPCTDSYAIYRVVKGELLTVEDDEEGMCELLRHMRVYFKGLAPRWVPREELSSVDGVVRDPRLRAGPLNDASNRFVANGLIRRCSNQLNGQPVFNIQGRQPSVRKQSNKTPKLGDKYYLEVEEEDKSDSLFHIIHALRPATVSVVFEDKRVELEKEIAKHYGDCVFKRNVSDECIRLSLSPPIEPHNKSRDLLIVLDSSLPRESYAIKDEFTVYLATSKEKEGFEKTGVAAYGPLSFVAFHQTL